MNPESAFILHPTGMHQHEGCWGFCAYLGNLTMHIKCLQEMHIFVQEKNAFNMYLLYGYASDVCACVCAGSCCSHLSDS